MYVPSRNAAAIDDRRTTTSRAQVAHRLTTSLLAVVAALAGHELGYALAPLAGTTSHGHLDLALRVLPALGLIAFARRALADEERAVWARRHLTVGRLAGLQLATYLAIEVGERLVQGAPLAELTGPAVLLGAAVQVPIAALVLLGLRTTQRVIARILDRPAAIAPALPAHVAARPALATYRCVQLGSLGPRAPPLPARPS
jgi:hypothetical protein